jgi:hypothetical protein
MLSKGQECGLEIKHACTRYFMNKMSGRRNKNGILLLMDGDKKVEGDNN